MPGSISKKGSNGKRQTIEKIVQNFLLRIPALEFGVVNEPRVWASSNVVSLLPRGVERSHLPPIRKPALLTTSVVSGCFRMSSDVLPAFLLLDPLGTFFGCFLAVFNGGHSAPL